MVCQTLSKKSQIDNQTEILEVLKMQAEAMKKTNDLLKSSQERTEQFFQKQSQQNEKLANSQTALLKAVTLFLYKQ